MAERKALQLTDTFEQFMMKMSEGNPGALTVLMQIVDRDPALGMLQILNLDDMNMRGCQIWVGYKDHCGEDIDRFIEAMKSRDPQMVEVVNRECPDWVAKTHGATPKG
jgi:hypothetical protein